MRASVIIPSHRSQQTLPRTLQSLEVAANGLEIETVVIEDAEGRGPSWARNRGLDRATGDIVFFCDADDAVRPDFFRVPIAALESSGADLCFFSYAGGPKLEASDISGCDAVRARYLPAFFGYSFDDVRRWNSGGSLMARKEHGQVWRCAYSRSFLQRNKIRFDERIRLYEDAAFLSECVAFATRVVSVPDCLYDYTPSSSGNMATGANSRRHWDYKFLAMEFRKRLDEATGGAVWRYCEASCVFSALEMMRLWRSAGLTFAEFREGLSRYLGDERVAGAVRRFPLSVRHPLTAAAVLALRGLIGLHG